MKAKSDRIVRYALVCDDIREEKSGKETLVGVYSNKIIVGGLPAVLPKLCFRIRITPIRRPLDISLSLRAPEGGDSITGLKAVLPARAEESGEHTLNLVMSPFVLKAEGEYSLIVEHGGKEETALKFTAEVLKTPVVRQPKD